MHCPGLRGQSQQPTAKSRLKKVSPSVFFIPTDLFNEILICASTMPLNPSQRKPETGKSECNNCCRAVPYWAFCPILTGFFRPCWQQCFRAFNHTALLGSSALPAANATIISRIFFIRNLPSSFAFFWRPPGSPHSSPRPDKEGQNICSPLQGQGQEPA